jgi:hypothetical protein
MTMAEAATLCGLPRRAIRRRVSEGVLAVKCRKMPRYYLFSRDALIQQWERWLSDGESAAKLDVAEEAERQWARRAYKSQWSVRTLA